jgi:hypothetical protein
VPALVAQATAAGAISDAQGSNTEIPEPPAFELVRPGSPCTDTVPVKESRQAREVLSGSRARMLQMCPVDHAASTAAAAAALATDTDSAASVSTAACTLVGDTEVTDMLQCN